MRIARSFSAVVSSLLVAALVACAPTAKREGTGEYIDDSVITGKVKAALVADPVLKATEINVETFKGTVQLSGFVGSPDDIPKAVQLARGVAGVKSVKNDILVKH
jgi:osmotically-inducible protein OsmY